MISGLSSSYTGGYAGLVSRGLVPTHRYSSTARRCKSTPYMGLRRSKEETGFRRGCSVIEAERNRRLEQRSPVKFGSGAASRITALDRRQQTVRSR